MTRADKIAAGILIVSLAASFVLFGLWEDKVWLLAPVMVAIYGTLAVCLVAAARRGALWTPPGGIPLLLFWLYSLVSIFRTTLPYEAKISTLCFGCYLAVYWASANIFSRFRYRKAVWSAFLVILVFTALYSLVQHRTEPNKLFGLERYADYWVEDRLGGTYQCPNHIAHLFQMWIPFGLVFVFIRQMGWFWRICFAYAVPVFSILIYQTQSRAGLLGSVAAVSTTALFAVLHRSRRAFCIALLIVPLLGAAAVGGLWTFSGMFRERMQPVVNFVTMVASGRGIEANFNDFRPLTWLDTITMIKDRPLLGFGPGSYGAVFEDYRTRWGGLRIEAVHAHNEYLELPAEYGLIGSALILAAIAIAVYKLIRFIRFSTEKHHTLPAVALLGVLAGTAVHGFFDFELHIFPNALMLALLAGCAAAPLGRVKPSGRHLPAKVFNWVFAGAVVLSAFWSMQVMSSAWVSSRGDVVLRQQRFDLAEKLYKCAVRIDPQNAGARMGLGRVYYHHRYYALDPEQKREWALKERDACAGSFRINPKKEEAIYGLGRAELFLGNREQGLDLLRQAAGYKRFNDFYWRKLGIELRKAGLYDEAGAAFEHARKLNSSNSSVNRNIEWLKKRKAQGK